VKYLPDREEPELEDEATGRVSIGKAGKSSGRKWEETAEREI
jgi:hypothetical protein